MFDDAVISSFQAGIRDTRMREKMAVNDDLGSVTKMFDMADKCAKAEEGRRLPGLDLHESQEEASKNKAKDVKRKALVVITAESIQKRDRDDVEADEGGSPTATSKSLDTTTPRSVGT